jgi:pimeloyl-ACP methyl ester carboxylesterase
MRVGLAWWRWMRRLLLLGALGGCAAVRQDAAPEATVAQRLTLAGPTSFQPWEGWKLTRAESPALDVYVMRDGTPRPLLVLLAGSGCTPLFFHVEREGKRLTGTRLTFAISLMGNRSGLHVATVEKVGVRSFELFSGDGMHDCPEEYERHVAKPARVRAVAGAITALAAEPWVTQVLLVGHSEGADIAAGVARLLGEKRLAAVGIMGGAGPSQLFDHVLFARRDAEAGSVRAAFDEVLRITEPEARGRWNGHSLARWRSFAVEATPLDDLRASRVPVFIAHGTEDGSVPIESADLLAIELLRDRSRPVFYLYLPGHDHGFRGPDRADNARAVLDRFLVWALEQPGKTGVQEGLTSTP